MNAILSVYNKTGVAAFAHALHERGIALIATDGTARELAKCGVPATTVAEFTGSPELLGGQVKTLHPRIHAAIATGEIGMIVVNLMPTGDGAGKPLAKMDIGGVTLIKAGIKHVEHVAVITEPAQYDAVLGELRAGGGLARETKLRLAKVAMRYLVTYDAGIAKLLEELR